ncbi:hypothetical protein FGF1_14810 [Flavobacteriaceae bacterium GF1]
MKKKVLLIGFVIAFFCAIQTNGQAWVSLGATYSNPSPYPYNYFLLMDMNGFNGDISAEFEVLVLADDNYMYHSRNSIFVSRHSATPSNRLDGVSMNYLSGKPGMLEVLVKNSQVWIRATAKWGTIKYRMIDGLGHGNWTTPLTSQTTPPTDILAFSTQPFYYDFDAAQINHFPSLLPNGNVGIGTANPGAYKLAVNGNIHAQEVKVDLVGWPDYVLKEGYNLPGLEEVEQHIREKGHLINIPSAAKVKENGVHLGEMNKLLLEKIEELTLYTLQQEKRIKELEKKDNEK